MLNKCSQVLCATSEVIAKPNLRRKRHRGVGRATPRPQLLRGKTESTAFSPRISPTHQNNFFLGKDIDETCQRHALKPHSKLAWNAKYSQLSASLICFFFKLRFPTGIQ